MSEREILARLRERFPRIGDDAAVLGDEVITTDMLIEGVDFTRAIPLQHIARKSLAVNLSDIAAMGGRPARAVVALALPDASEIEPFMFALADYARECGVEIIGGDLSHADKLIVCIAAFGTATRPLFRNAARRGHRIFVSRPLGASAAGLSLITRWSSITPPADLAYENRELVESAIRRHIDPEPEIALGMKLAAIAETGACIDISDGLSTDLGHICEASQLGAEIERQRIPVFADLPRLGPALGINVRDAVLHGGEEFALLFTSSLRESELSAQIGRPVYAIGRMVAEPGVRMDGQPLEARGWDHFA